MLHLNPQEIYFLRKENSHLKTSHTKLKSAFVSQKQKTEKVEEENKTLKKKVSELEKELEKIKKQRDKYKGMIFKSNLKKDPQNFKISAKKKKLGGQLGHIGASRKLPQKVDEVKRIFFHHCPNCGGKLRRTNSIDSHTVDDIPNPQEAQLKVTKFEVERQWCGSCSAERVATPVGVIPNSRLGINLIVQVLIWKYICRMSFEIIVQTLFQTFGLSLTSGGLINILKRTKQYLGEDYGELLTIIRGSPVKHADETGWRIQGLNGWLWAFLTKSEVYYTIETTRGKGVAEKVLATSKKDDVLVRDDYAGYKNLKVNHQSCWVHLLRESREAVAQKQGSKEVKLLHKRLKKMYQQLQIVIKLPFNLPERQVFYQTYLNQLNNIIQTDFLKEDAKKIQVRIRNQNQNLITALIYPDVPLTNNAAERQIRPAVIIRKISGGSRSEEGAQTFAVNMSVIQTLKLRNQPLISTLHNLLLKGALGKTN